MGSLASAMCWLPEHSRDKQQRYSDTDHDAEMALPERSDRRGGGSGARAMPTDQEIEGQYSIAAAKRTTARAEVAPLACRHPSIQ